MANSENILLAPHSASKKMPNHFVSVLNQVRLNIIWICPKHFNTHELFAANCSTWIIPSERLLSLLLKRALNMTSRKQTNEMDFNFVLFALCKKWNKNTKSHTHTEKKMKASKKSPAMKFMKNSGRKSATDIMKLSEFNAMVESNALRRSMLVRHLNQLSGSCCLRQI